MGCLKNLIRAVIITLAVVGFLSLGGKDFVAEYIGGIFRPSPEKMLEKAKKVGDFSAINEEFELEKVSGMFGYNGVVAEHKSSGQKLIVVDSGSKPIFTQEDIKSEKVADKIQDALGKIKIQAISVEDIEIVKHGEIYSYGQYAPYVRFNAKVSKLPVGNISGIIAVAKNKDNEDRLLISANEKNKYSQLIADEFFKKVK